MNDNVKAIVTYKGIFVEIVMIDKENNPIGFRPLAEGERLVDVGRYNDYVKPLYDEALKDFKESATPEEIESAIPSLKNLVSEDKKYKDMVDFLMNQFIENEAIKRI